VVNDEGFRMASSLRVDTFLEFKEVVSTQSMRVKWAEIGNYYELRAFDNFFSIEYSLEKTDPKNADQIDFEDNFKDEWVKPNVTKSVITFGDNEWPELTGFFFTANHGGETIAEYEFEKAYQLQGGAAYFKDSQIGDYIELEVYDKNNVIGYGGGFVLHQYIKRLYVFPNSYNEFKDVDLAQLPVGGLFVRVRYHSIGSTNVECVFNFFTYIIK